MKNLTMFMVVGAIAAALAPFALQGCAGTIGTCSTDQDCGAGQTCVNGTCSGGEGEGEGEGGEGEGEGAGGNCSGLDATVGTAGSSVTATDANLAPDASNAACTAGGTNACDAITGTSCYSFDVTVTGTTASAVDGNNAAWITWANTGGDPAGAFTETFCNGGAVGCSDDAANNDTICTCGMCLSTAPTDLAVAVNDGSTDSTGVCVNVTP